MEGDGRVRHHLEVTSLSVGENFSHTKTDFPDKLLGPLSLVRSESVVSGITAGASDTSSETNESTVPTSNYKVSTQLGIEAELHVDLGLEVYDLTGSTVNSFVQSRIENREENGSFLVTNLATVKNQYAQWLHELPMVKPFYAVKCNPDLAVLRLLARLGANFDCATMGEIDLVLNSLGTDSFKANDKAYDGIVYANPAKMPHMLEFAANNGVSMTVFDGEDELYKIASLPACKNMRLLLRLATDDRASVCRFSKKFGCPVDEATHLLEVAKELGLNVAGVSFHVGSGCGDANAYKTAIEDALTVFTEGDRLGFPPMTILDIGGGFPGDTSGYGGPGMPTFQDLAAVIRQSIADFTAAYPHDANALRFIAEPGRYFISASTTITTKVYSRKGGKNAFQALYVDDGVYGSFNNVVYDHVIPVPRKLSAALNTEKTGVANMETEDCIPTAVFGPTCDGLDQMCTLENTVLPRCEVDDWLVWEAQGAYTHTASFIFNGYTHIPKKTYVYC